IRSSGWMRYGFAMLMAGLLISAFQAEHQAAAWLRVLEIMWCGCLFYAAARLVATDKRLVFVILVAMVVAYSLSNFRLILQWMFLEDPRAKDWAFAIPGYFHYRNLGFAATPALIILAWLPFSARLAALEGSRRKVAHYAIFGFTVLGWAVL